MEKKDKMDLTDYSLGNWLALNAGPEEIDRWNALVEYCQRTNAAILAAEELAKAVVDNAYRTDDEKTALIAFRAAMEDTQ